MDSIDKAAVSVGNEWANVLAQVEARYGSIKNLPADRILAIFESIDFADIVRREYGAGKAAEVLGKEYLSTLLATTPIVAVPDEVLSALVSNSFDVYDKTVDLQAAKIKNLMVRSAIGNQTEAEFAAALKTEAMTQAQANALANDTLRKFSRTVSAEMAETAPEGQLWIWDGPIDDRTSPECLDLIAMGPAPREAFGAAFTEGTHFNCRHSPQPYVGRARQNKEAGARAQEKRNEG